MADLDCKCRNWCSVESVAWNHHPSCPSFNPGKDARAIVEALVNGIENWAHDEDGVHPDCWEAYKNARSFLMNPIEKEDA